MFLLQGLTLFLLSVCLSDISSVLQSSVCCVRVASAIGLRLFRSVETLCLYV